LGPDDRDDRRCGTANVTPPDGGQAAEVFVTPVAESSASPCGDGRPRRLGGRMRRDSCPHRVDALAESTPSVSSMPFAAPGSRPWGLQIIMISSRNP
jgi:hypothetical protein